MKKIIFILVVVLAIIGFAYCTYRAEPVTSATSATSATSVSSESSENKRFSDFINLELLVKSGYDKIYVDKNTGVLYYNKNTSPKFSGSLVPIYNTDGSLKNIKQYE